MYMNMYVSAKIESHEIFILNNSLTAATLIRCDEDTHQHELLLEQADSLHAVLDSLNSLGTFPWTINKRVSNTIYNVHV